MPERRGGGGGRRGEGTGQVMKRLRGARKCYPGHTRAPRETRTRGRAIEIINNEMGKTSYGHFGERDGACPGLSLRLGGNGPGTTEVKPGSVAHSLGGLFGPLGLRQVRPLDRWAVRRALTTLGLRGPLTQCTAAGTAAHESCRPPRISTGSAAPPLDVRFARRLPSPVQTNTPARK